MKRFVPLFIFLTFLLSGCDSNREKNVFVSDLQGASLDFDGDVSLMTRGWLRLQHRKSDNSWELGLKLQDYDELVYNQENCTTEFAPEKDMYSFFNSGVDMDIIVNDSDCVINLFTNDSQSICVSMWPASRKDAKKIREGIEKYCKYTTATVKKSAGDNQRVSGAEATARDSDREAFSDPEMATDVEDIQFHVKKEKTDDGVYYYGESDHMMSEYMSKVSVEIISNPDPNKRSDITHTMYFLDYSGRLVDTALEIMNRYNGKTVQAKFYFSDGSSYIYDVAIDNLTPPEWEEMDAGLGNLYLAFRPLGIDSYDKKESQSAYEAVTTQNITDIVIGGKIINLRGEGFRTGYLFGNLFVKMAKVGAFGPQAAEEFSENNAPSAPSSSKTSSSKQSSTQQSSASKPTSKADPANGHEWVDLGLSVKWATCNVGASTPGGYGYFYAWGEISPKKEYKWDNYVFWTSGNSESDFRFSKYNTNGAHGPVDNKTRLDLSDDVAHRQWGGSWRIPTNREWMELWNKCTWTWTSKEGHSGYEVTSNLNGKSIFLPAAGEHFWTTVSNRDVQGNYWSSDLDDFNRSYYALGVSFKTDGKNPLAGFRNDGFSVRPVIE